MMQCHRALTHCAPAPERDDRANVGLLEGGVDRGSRHRLGRARRLRRDLHELGEELVVPQRLCVSLWGRGEEGRTEERRRAEEEIEEEEG